MGIDSTVASKNRYKVRQSPKIQLGSKIDEDEKKDTLICRSYFQKSPGKEYTEFCIGNSPSLSCKSLPSKLARGSDDIELRRGSIYQSSENIRRVQKKTTSSHNSDISLSVSIIDSLSGTSQSEGNPPHPKKSPLISPKALNLTSGGSNDSLPNFPKYLDYSFRHSVDQCKTDNIIFEEGLSEGFVEICLDSEGSTKGCRVKTLADSVEADLLEEPRLKCDQTIAPEIHGSSFFERGLFSLPKSSSEKLRLPNSPSQSEPDLSKPSTKVRFSPFRRMLDPIMKSKSQRSSPVSESGIGGGRSTSDSPDVRKNRGPRKSLLRDFSKTDPRSESTGYLVKKDSNLVAYSSPAHLHGLLKVEHKHGVPFFEFSLNNQDNVLSAKMWRTDKACNWAYTFHSINKRRNSDNSGWGTKVKHRQSSMVGQMQVSCYLFSELGNGGSVDYSTITECILYDLAQATRAQEGSNSPTCESNIAAPYPWVPMELHPHLEIAAIVIQVPFDMRQRLENKIGNKLGGRGNPDPLLSFSAADRTSLGKVKVVTPRGTHGLPSTEEGAPSPLLDRWRSGGGCDCGGWDMGCPIVLFDNPCVESVKNYLVLENQRPLELFVEGAKEKIPALAMQVVDGRQYSVDFHAQLSSLQAFSICVAILHGEEVPIAIQTETNRQRLQCNPLKVLLEQEVKLFSQGVTQEEKTKAKEEIPSPFQVDPPFSPFGRA